MNSVNLSLFSEFTKTLHGTECCSSNTTNAKIGSPKKCDSWGLLLLVMSLISYRIHIARTLVLSELLKQPFWCQSLGYNEGYHLCNFHLHIEKVYTSIEVERNGNSLQTYSELFTKFSESGFCSGLIKQYNTEVLNLFFTIVQG